MSPKTGMLIGVIVSAVLVGGIVIGVVVVKTGGGSTSIGEPTEVTTAKGVLDKIEINLDIGKIAAPPPEGGTGAAELYLAAAKQMDGMGDDFAEKLTMNLEPEKDEKYKAILDKLEAAADKGIGDADLNFESLWPLSPGQEWKSREKLVALGSVAERCSLSMRADKNREGAEKATRALLIYGQRLYKNGVYVAYKSAGINDMSLALALYGRHYSPAFFNDAGKAAAAKELDAVFHPPALKWMEKEKIVRNVRTETGDAWNLAENDKDRAWRMDGLMWLGILRWAGSNASHRPAIEKYLGEKAGSADPLVAKRAKAALEYSLEDMHTFK